MICFQGGKGALQPPIFTEICPKKVELLIHSWVLQPLHRAPENSSHIKSHPLLIFIIHMKNWVKLPQAKRNPAGCCEAACAREALSAGKGHCFRATINLTML